MDTWTRTTERRRTHTPKKFIPIDRLALAENHSIIIPNREEGRRTSEWAKHGRTKGPDPIIQFVVFVPTETWRPRYTRAVTSWTCILINYLFIYIYYGANISKWKRRIWIKIKSHRKFELVPISWVQKPRRPRTTASTQLDNGHVQIMSPELNDVTTDV